MLMRPNNSSGRAIHIHSPIPLASMTNTARYSNICVDWARARFKGAIAGSKFGGDVENRPLTLSTISASSNMPTSA